MKHVDLEKPIMFLDQVHLRCTQRECKPDDNNLDRESPQDKLKSCVVQEM